jgi:hypothetical protein
MAAPTTSIGKSFTIEWGRGNVCHRDDDGNYLLGCTTAAACTYRIKPFYYMEEEAANSGQQQLFPHVSYLVDMDRSKDLTDCSDDHWRLGHNMAPAAPDITAQTGTFMIHIDPLAAATDENPEDQGRLVIQGIAAASTGTPAWSLHTSAGATVRVDNGQVSYYPPFGTWSSDSFYAFISDHDQVTPVKVTVDRAGVVNGDFDSLFDGWTGTGLMNWSVAPGNTDGRPLPGPFADGMAPSTEGTLSQTFTVPSSGTGQLTVWRRAQCRQSGAIRRTHSRCA